jgi:subtilase family serine protease
LPVGGTSEGAPQWAAIIAIVNAQRIAAGKQPLSNAISSLYTLGRNGGAFRDITQGTNCAPGGATLDLNEPTPGFNGVACVPENTKASIGWDAVSGWGSPVGTVLINGLLGM